jgi:patatin-like phospholipase/acyl hydrolase
MRRVGGKNEPSDLFDIVCGTSTGGIIAVLLTMQRRKIEETEALYDDFIERVFSKKNTIKLALSQAAYEEDELEKILYAMLGDELMVDSNRREDCPRVFCVSAKLDAVVPQTKLWRNYNYPPDDTSSQHQHQGSFRINTMTALRATTAAPTYFTTVPWEGSLYCDGAIVANNPTMLAIQEAKVRDRPISYFRISIRRSNLI